MHMAVVADGPELLPRGCQTPLIPDGDGRIGVWLGNGQATFPQKRDVLLYPPPGLIKTVLHRMPHACEPLEVGGIEPEERRVFGSFYNQRMLDLKHLINQRLSYHCTNIGMFVQSARYLG